MNKRVLVASSEWLYRRGYSTPEKKYMNPDGTATSRVFSLREKDNGELSVDVKSLISPESSVGDSSKYFLFELPNIEVENIGLSTFHDPTTDPSSGIENHAHAVIIGLDINDDILPGLLARKSKRVYF